MSKLAVIEDVDDIIGDPGQEAGIVSHVVGIIVTQVLKTGIVSHLAWRKKGLGLQVSGHHGEARKSQSRALGSVGKGLGHGEGRDSTLRETCRHESYQDEEHRSDGRLHKYLLT